MFLEKSQSAGRGLKCLKLYSVVQGHAKKNCYSFDELDCNKLI